MSVILVGLIVALVLGACYYLLRGSPQEETQSSESNYTNSAGASYSPSPTPSKSKGTKASPKKNEKSNGTNRGSLRTLTLFQVSSAPDTLFGRKKEMVQLVNQYNDGGRLFGICGPPGIGKSALGMKLAEQLSTQCADGQLFFNFHWVSNPDRSVAEAMAHVIHSFQPELKTPATDKEIVQLYRSVLKDKRMLLMFENVPGLKEAQSLEPPASCTLLITSETKFPFQKMHWEELGPLEKEDMGEFLIDLSHRIGFWAAEISKYCSYNPLAAEMCGQLIAENSELDPAVLATKFRDLNQNLAKKITDRNQCGLETSLTMVNALIHEGLRPLLERLLIFPDTFTGEAETFICEDRENLKLEVLMRLGIIRFNDASDRYCVPYTLRQWFLKKLKPKLPPLVCTRHATYFMTQLQAAHELFETGDPKKKAQALKYFDLEWGNIRAGQAWVKENCLKDQDSARICFGYFEYGYELLRHRQTPDLRLTWLEGAVLAAQTLQDEEGELSCLVLQGQEALNLKQFDKAVEVLEKSQALAQKLNHSERLLDCLHSMGKALCGQNKNEQALACFNQEQGQARKLGLTQVQLRAEEEIARMYKKAGHYDQAKSCLEAALNTAAEMGDPVAELRLGREVAEVLLQMGNAGSAVDILQKLLENPKAGEDKMIRAELLMGLGEAFRSLNEPAKASPYYEQARQLWRGLNKPAKFALALGWQGLCLLTAGDEEGGAKMLKQARTQSRKAGDVESELLMLQEEGLFYLEKNNLDVAATLFDQECQLARKAKLGKWQQSAHLNMGNVLEKQGKFSEALTHLKTTLKYLENRQPQEAKALKARIEKIQKSATAA